MSETKISWRLTGTVILWLLEDQVFWEEIEQGPEPLGPFGLQQFYLDMKFVIIFGQGRFLSRHVHQVILDIIGGAMSAFSATGMNPDSFMPTHIRAETDLRFVYCAAAVCSMLKDWTGMEKEKAKQYILNC